MPDDALTIEEFEALVGGRVEAIEPIGESMPITKEMLQTEIASLRRQRDDAEKQEEAQRARKFGAEGAIQAYSALIAQMQQEAANAAEQPATKPNGRAKRISRKPPAIVEEQPSGEAAH